MVSSSPLERHHASWLGGSILSICGSFQQLWITKSEYQEYGSVSLAQHRLKYWGKKPKSRELEVLRIGHAILPTIVMKWDRNDIEMKRYNWSWIPSDSVQYNERQYNTMQCGVVWCSMVWLLKECKSLEALHEIEWNKLNEINWMKWNWMEVRENKKEENVMRFWFSYRLMGMIIDYRNYSRLFTQQNSQSDRERER